MKTILIAVSLLTTSGGEFFYTDYIWFDSWDECMNADAVSLIEDLPQKDLKIAVCTEIPKEGESKSGGFGVYRGG